MPCSIQRRIRRYSWRVDFDPLCRRRAAAAPIGLEQQQALVGRGREQPPAAAFLHQVLVILRRLEAEQRQLEAVLAARLAVAAAAVAAELGEDRHDLIGEVDRQVGDEVRHLHLDVAVDARRGDDMHGRFAFGNRRDQARDIDVDDAGRARLHRSPCGSSRGSGRCRILAGDDDLLAGIAAGDRHHAVLQPAGFDGNRGQLTRITQTGGLGFGGGRRLERWSQEGGRASAARRRAAAGSVRMVGSFANCSIRSRCSITVRRIGRHNQAGYAVDYHGTWRELQATFNIC